MKVRPEREEVKGRFESSGVGKVWGRGEGWGVSGGLAVSIG